MRQFVIAAILLWLLAIAGISTANAGQLSVNAPTQAALFTAAKCANASPATTAAGTATNGTYSQVAVSNIPAACQNRPMTVFVHGANGALITQGSTTATSATATVTTGATYSAAGVTAVVVRFDGWLFPTTWTAPPPVATPAISCVAINNGGNVTGQPCTVTVTNTTFWTAGGPFRYLQIDFSVSAPQNRYEVTIDYSHPSWPGGGFTPVYVGSGYNVINAPGYSCNALPIHRSWKAAGNVAWENGGVIFATNDPNTTNGTARLCP